MPWFLTDYLRDTLHLSLEEDGVYRRALDYLWLNPGGLPTDRERLRRCLRLSEVEFGRTWEAVKPFLPVVDGVHRSPRLDVEYAKASHRSQQARDNRRSTGVERSSARPSDSSPSPSSSPSASPSTEENSPVRGLAFSEDSDPYICARDFDQHFLAKWAPNSKRADAAKLQKWAKEFDGILRIDKRSFEQVAALLQWLDVQKPKPGSEFLWRSHVLSPAKLRIRWNEGKFDASGFVGARGAAT